jgi:hypothetical protein
MRKFRWHSWWIATTLLTIPVLVGAQNFTPGTPILSTAVNTRFASLAPTVSHNCTFNSSLGVTDCACANGQIAIGGGAYQAGALYLQESRNPTELGPINVWRVTCADASGTRKACAAAQAICMKAAP